MQIMVLGLSFCCFVARKKVRVERAFQWMAEASSYVKMPAIVVVRSCIDQDLSLVLNEANPERIPNVQSSGNPKS
jgi:hypothetical protein